ncbi:MAG TPA: hypothetical protein VHR16_09830 [Candidatus Limnocylindrales bacterium]|jgi:hypothetical protein|nr:hypothetical protein [Candidatus Limnocylindrales bacterium]
MSDSPRPPEREPHPGAGAPFLGKPADDRPGRSCARCGAAVAWTVKVFCRNHASRFAGRVYCVACQRAFPAT